MIEEVVNSILQAEDEAKKRVENAEREAGEIVSNAEAEADRLKKLATADNKAYLNEKLAAADEQALQEARKLLEELTAKTDAEMTELEKRLRTAGNKSQLHSDRDSRQVRAENEIGTLLLFRIGQQLLNRNLIELGQCLQISGTGP